ncbi:hypothetical protein D9M70_486170 [compost metagenome]
MIAATVELFLIVFLGFAAIHWLGVWARSSAAPRSPKSNLGRSVAGPFTTAMEIDQ